MRDDNSCPPLSGPASDPVLYGVAQGLAQLFPPVDPPRSEDDAGTDDEQPDETERWQRTA